MYLTLAASAVSRVGLVATALNPSTIIYIYISIYVYMYIYTYIAIYMYIYIYVADVGSLGRLARGPRGHSVESQHEYLNLSTSIYTHTYLYICIHVYIYICSLRWEPRPSRA